MKDISYAGINANSYNLPMMRATFRKKERLVSKNDIEQLFTSGSRSFSVFPIRVVYRKVDEEDEFVKVLVSVSKRHFKHAVDRNCCKRQIREAYRLQKQILFPFLEENRLHLHIAFIWMSDNLDSFENVSKSINRLLHLIVEKNEFAH